MNNLSLIWEKIEANETVLVNNLLNLSEIHNLGYDNLEDFLAVLKQLNSLPRSDSEKFIAVDLDDCLYSRQNSLQNSLLSENRWEAWNRVIETHMWWFKKYTFDHYNPSWSVKQMVDILLKSKNSCILTAWKKYFQYEKLNRIWIDDSIPVSVVNSTSEKPKKLLEFIIFELGFIPGEIDIYDDRVEHFHKCGPVLSKILQSSINIHETILCQNKTDGFHKINKSRFQLDLLH